jgi:hypothetical protein
MATTRADASPVSLVICINMASIAKLAEACDAQPGRPDDSAENAGLEIKCGVDFVP